MRDNEFLCIQHYTKKTDDVPDQKSFRFTPDVLIHFDIFFRMSIIILTFCSCHNKRVTFNVP